MIELVCQTGFLEFPNIWDVLSLVLAIFAMVLSFGYYVRPKIKCCISYGKSKDKGRNRIRVKLFNNNRTKRLLVNIKCEMTLSKDENSSGEVRTLKLLKDSIICLPKEIKQDGRPYYVFKSDDDHDNLDKDTYTHFRVRFLIPNFIGVQKAYELVMPIEQFIKSCGSGIPYKPK